MVTLYVDFWLTIHARLPDPVGLPQQDHARLQEISQQETEQQSQ